MNMDFYFRTTLILTLFLSILANISFAQTSNFPKPREERLLNELKLLIWYQPNAEKVTVKLRIHSGSAFDPKDKMGTLALLSDVLFADESTKKFFEDDLKGSLEIINDYDYIQVNATAKSAEFLTILETLAPAILNPAINKETTARAKAKRLKFIKDLEKHPKYVAERAVAKKLLGEFPYGRPKDGTIESVEKIDFADLIFARQRFMTSDNATIVIIGNIKSSFAYRAVRRHFGGWGKKTEKIPSSFRLPEKPDMTPQTIDAEGNEKRIAHFALNGISRRDSDYYASKVIEKILNQRVKKTPDQYKKTIDDSARLRSYLLRGLYHITFTSRSVTASDADDKTFLKEILGAQISQNVFELAKSQLLSEMANQHFSESYLDIDTFRLQSVKDEVKKASAVTLSDVRKVANSLKLEPATQTAVRLRLKDTSLEQDPDPKDPKK